ncbi:MAG TPA: serine/threonine-protein kinase, partial [Candidatus Obscuribacterales bacterium]
MAELDSDGSKLAFLQHTGSLDQLELTVNEFQGLPRTAALTEEALAFAWDPDSHVYQVLHKLGEGAMGSVHLVRDCRLQRRVALKQLLSQWQQTPGTSQRFLSEVQITAQLAHPYIVPVYSIEMTEQGIGYTMKRVQGLTFKELIAEAKADVQARGQRQPGHDLPTMLEQFLKVCDALAYAHFRQVIHRDLKPANLMLGDHGEVYVMDWGIARPFGDQAHEYPFEADEKGKMIGTPRYMSPEQARGVNDRLDARSDLFALGLILDELVCLRPSYTAKNSAELLEKVRKGQTEPIVAADFKVPRALQAIIAKATRWKRAERYESVTAFAEDIRHYLRDQAVAAEPDPPLQAALRWLRHHRTACLGALFAVLLASSALTVSNLYRQQQVLQQAAAREQVISGFWSQVLHQGQAIDKYLLVVPRVLESIAGMGQQALQHGKPGPEPYFLDDLRWNDLVPNQIKSSHYGALISLDHTAFTLAAGLTEAQLRQDLQRMAPLQRNFRNLFVRSAAKPGSDETRLLASEGVPIMFASFVTKSGINQYFPGTMYATPGYDPRKRPFYKLVENQRGMKCGNPYLDRLAGSFLPCSL